MIVDVADPMLPGMPTAPERTEGDKRTRDRARTARQRRDVSAGVHPLLGGPVYPDRGTCGTCVHRYVVTWHSRSYPKCELRGESHGAASDCRAWWPACTAHKPRDTVAATPTE